MRMSAVLGVGVGLGMSLRMRFSGGPNAEIMIAFMDILVIFCSGLYGSLFGCV